MIIRDFETEDMSKGLIETYSEIWTIDEIKKKTIEDFISNDNHMVVCEVDGEIIGTATLHIQKKIIRNGGFAGLIEDVAVREKMRGKGIGEKMIKILIDKAKSLDCYKVILSCFPERINFYERSGFRKESITMRYNIK
jgi:N-acetylglutamate synthase-like GNAT family acetyltransferase